MAISFVALAALYLGVYYTVHEYFSLTQIPVTPWSIALCVLLADLAYCFEHRFSHRVPGRPTPFTTARRISTGHCCQRKNRERSKTRSKVELGFGQMEMVFAQSGVQLPQVHLAQP